MYLNAMYNINKGSREEEEKRISRILWRALLTVTENNFYWKTNVSNFWEGTEKADSGAIKFVKINWYQSLSDIFKINKVRRGNGWGFIKTVSPYFFFFFFAIRKDSPFYFDIHYFGAGKEKIKKTEHLSE